VATGGRFSNSTAGKIIHRVSGNSREHICKPCIRIDIVELGGLCHMRHRQVSTSDVMVAQLSALDPSRRDSAGIPALEAVVTYPFHPLVGQAVVVN
jgi:hypothetical protein